MSLATSDGGSGTQRVPAWRRIGLKLKSEARQSEQDAQSKNIVVSNGDSQKASNGPDDVRPAKKRRTAIESTKSSDHEVANEVASSSSLQRRKSVSFTPETKPGNDANSRRTTDDIKTYTGDLSNGEQTTPLSKQSKKVKPRTKAKQTGPDSANTSDSLAHSSAVSSVSQVPEYVKYVECFYSDKSSWKFNKKKQKDLLKNLFNLHRIPSKHNPAILQYISGLQGSAARQRLIESGTEVLRSIAEKDDQIDLDSMESEQARREAYGAALKRYLEQLDRRAGSSEYDDQQLAEMRLEAERGERAEAVLGQLLRNELWPEQSQAVKAKDAPQVLTPDSHQSNGAGAASRNGRSTTSTKSSRRKRKSRTQVSSDESSSESESSSEESSKPATKVQRISPAIKPKGTKTIFDDDLLDTMFPKEKSYHATAPKRRPEEKKSKARGFAYTHGSFQDESGSESD